MADSDVPVAPRTALIQAALTGAIASTLFFLLCWMGAFLPLGPATHMYIQLFTDADVNSGAALLQGLVWSVIFGLIAGALLVLSARLVASLDRR